MTAAPFDLVFRAPRVITAAGEVARCIAVRAGRVAAIEPLAAGLSGERTITLPDSQVLLPGLVDTHVHVNEPGRTEWEGFASATRAAAAGGITTIVDMPLNSIPPTVDVAALEVKRKAAEGQVHVDIGFWGGAIPGNLGELRGLHDAGVFGFKCFLLHSGVDEFPHLDADELEAYLQILAGFPALLLVHAEDSASIERAPSARGDHYSDFLRSRPRGSENVAIAHVIEGARWTGARVHILHLSSSDALPMLRSARRDGVKISVETCPHYLTFDAGTIPDGATRFKCCPPIRDAANRERLWQGLAEGVVDLVASDHSPCPPELKRPDSGDFGAAWGGISSLQLGLSLVWTGARRRGIELSRVIDWMATGTAAFAGLSNRGAIAPGLAANLVIFAPEDSDRVHATALHHRNPVTPYEGWTLDGVVRATYLRGERIDHDHPQGQLLSRNDQRTSSAN